jgi:hypothetical protein
MLQVASCKFRDASKERKGKEEFEIASKEGVRNQNKEKNKK